MENVFRNNDLTDYNRAVAEHANALASKQAQAKDDTDRYNEIKASILEPFGTATLHPVVKNLMKNRVKPAIKRMLGKANEEARRMGNRAISDVRAGRNPLDAVGEDLRNAVSKVKATASDASEVLSQAGLDKVNGARARRGRRAVRKTKAPEPKSGEGRTADLEEGETPISSSQLDSQAKSFLDDVTPVPKKKPLFDLGDEKPIEALKHSEATEVDAFSSGLPEDLDNIVSDIASGKITLDHGLIRANQAGYRVFKPPARPLEASPSAQDSLAPMRAGMEREDPSSLAQANKDKPVNPEGDEENKEQDEGSLEREDPNLKQVAKETDKGGGSSGNNPGLEDEEETPEDSLLADAGEIEAGGGGPEDIFTDIIAGALSLGAIVGGAVGAEPTRQTAVNPSVQYGTA